MDATDAVGWTASAILIATLLRQVWVQWRERSTAGVFAWLFVGQVAASTAFTAYSVMLGNWVFVCANAAALLTAIAGQLVYQRNLKLERRSG